MTSIQLATKWSRMARLSLALATVAVPVCEFAQSTNTPKYTIVDLGPLHAVLWGDGNAIDLGNLGGDGRFAGIYATGLNDDGQVVGTSDTTGDASFHGFLWHQGHITDLGTLAGDSYSSATAISSNGMVLGVSVSASFSPRAVLWRDGTATASSFAAS